MATSSPDEQELWEREVTTDTLTEVAVVEVELPPAPPVEYPEAYMSAGVTSDGATWEFAAGKHSLEDLFEEGA